MIELTSPLRVVEAPRVEALHEKIIVWKADGALTAVDFGGYESRNASVLRLIEAAEVANDLPAFGPLLVHTGDRPIHPTAPGERLWFSAAFATAEGHEDIAVPDFLFDGWPQVGLDDYELQSTYAATAGAHAPVTPRLGWIGNCDTSAIRWQLFELGRRHPDLLDVRHVSWVPTPGNERLSTAAGNHMSLADQVREWGMLIDLEGNGWSARLKLLLHSGRPVFMQDRPWHEWYFPALEPMTHFVPVRRDLADLPERVAWALGHPAEVAAIGRAGQAFARNHLTRTHAIARWTEVLSDLGGRGPLPYAPEAIRAALDGGLRGLGAPV
jgi:hypothetical protein